MERSELRTRAREGTFVGREPELTYGLNALDDAVAGSSRLLLLAGEPGIGKSRLADELAQRARRRDVRVAWGRCWEAGGAPAYWPWVQSLRAIARELGAETLRALLPPGAAEVSQLLPELGAAAATSPPAPSPQDPDAARFLLFDSVTMLLINIAAAKPLMLVLDDLQVADTASLLLLQFAAAALGDERVLIVGTYRDQGLGRDHPLTSTLVELQREPITRLLSLRGFSEDDVAHVIGAAAGIAPQPQLVRALHAETEGNPFFVQELVRVLVEEGRLGEGAKHQSLTQPIPRSVREVIGSRLKPLTPESRAVLELASIFGREFDVHALSRLAEHSVDSVIEQLDEPLAMGVVTRSPGGGDVLRFSHVLVRDSLHDDIGRTRRTELHHRAAEVLEILYQADPEPHLAELAHHFFEGMSWKDAAKVVTYCRRAAQAAAGLLAYEEAVRLFRMALDATDRAGIEDPEQRCELLLALGEAQARAGDEAGSKQTLLAAAELTKELGEPALLARAALGYSGRLVWVRAGGDPHLIRLLRDALDAVGDSDPMLRVHIMARLGGALRDDPAPEPRESLAREAVALARTIGDQATLAYALDGLCAALWRPDFLDERLAIANEVIELGNRAQDRERMISGYQFRVWALLELGEVTTAYRDLDMIERLAEELHQRAHGWLPASVRVTLAVVEGRLADAESLVVLSHEERAGTNRGDAFASYTLLRFHLARERGRLADVEALLADSARDFPWYAHLRAALALLHCELGHRSEARALLDELAEDDFAAVHFDNKWLFAMSLLSEVACTLGDGQLAVALYERLLPYQRRNVIVAGDGGAGAMSRTLGLLAIALGRDGDAIDHLETALAENERMGNWPSVVRTQLALASVLLAAGTTAQARRAAELLSAAADICEERDLTSLRARVAAFRDEHGIESRGAGAGAGAAATGRPAAAARAGDEAAEFRLEGEFWSVTYGGTVSRLADSKGMRVLAELLGHPGRPHPSLDLERLGMPRTPGDDATVQAVASGNAGEVIDDEARRQYRARLAELRRELDDDAGVSADQAGAMREEMDFLTRELSRALGLGGRSRQAGSIAERARLNVSRAVRSALRRIAAADPALAEHLNATVRTGTVCTYTPDPRAPMAWRVSVEAVGAV